MDTAWTPDPDDDVSSEGISALQEKVSRIAERNAASSHTSKRVEIQTEPEAKSRFDGAGRSGYGGDSNKERYEADVRKAGVVDEDDDDGLGDDDDMDYDAEVAIWVDEASKCFGAQSEATHAVGLIAKLLMQRLPGMIAGIMADMLTPEVGESPFKSPVKSHSRAAPASPGDSWKYLGHTRHDSASGMGQALSPSRGSPPRQTVSEWGTAISPSQSRSPPRNVVGGGVEELLGEDEEEEGERGMPSLDELKLRALSQAQQGLSLATPQGLARMQSSTVCTETATVAKAVCILLGLKVNTLSLYSFTQKSAVSSTPFPTCIHALMEQCFWVENTDHTILSMFWVENTDHTILSMFLVENTNHMILSITQFVEYGLSIQCMYIGSFFYAWVVVCRSNFVAGRNIEGYALQATRARRCSTAARHETFRRHIRHTSDATRVAAPPCR